MVSPFQATQGQRLDMYPQPPRQLVAPLFWGPALANYKDISVPPLSLPGQPTRDCEGTLLSPDYRGSKGPLKWNMLKSTRDHLLCLGGTVYTRHRRLLLALFSVTQAVQRLGSQALDKAAEPRRAACSLRLHGELLAEPCVSGKPGTLQQGGHCL